MKEEKLVFVAALMPSDVGRQILEWQQEHSELDVRWKNPDNLHITLLAPWHTDQGGIRVSKRILGEVVETARPFAVEIQNVRWGPTKLMPRIIWSFGTIPREFSALKRRAQKALLENPKTGLRRAKKFPVVPHVTIASFRRRPLRELSPLNEKVRWVIPVEGFCFLESDPARTGTGKKYRVLKQFDFPTQ